MPTPETHALLSASSAGRWLHCPPSALLAAQEPQTSSDYAEAGRVAHAIGELKARKYFLEGIGPRVFSKRLKAIQADPHYDPGMDDATDRYLDALKEQAMLFDRPPFVALEIRVDYSDIAPGGYGTSDAVIIGGDTIVVADYKNGSGVSVDAEDNPQMKLYAYGALRTFGPMFGDVVQRVRLVIIQPHSGGVKTWETTRAELERWAHETVAPVAALAAEGKGDFRAGDWCDNYFCPVRAKCRARAEHLLALSTLAGAEPAGDREPDLGPPRLLSDDEVGQALIMARSLKKWMAALEAYAESALLAGKPIPGWKLVEGEASRCWDGGEDRAFPVLMERGVPEAMLYERKPVTPPALEKLLSKKEFEERAAGLVLKSPGKPAMALESDKRPAWSPAEAAFTKINTTEEDNTNV